MNVSFKQPMLSIEAECCVGIGLACQCATAGLPTRLVLMHRAEQGGGWVLTALIESSGSEKLRQLLLAKQWDAATLLAQTHGLDTDRVLQCASPRT